MTNDVKTKRDNKPLADVNPSLSLDEYCRRLSETVKRPELLGAFHYSEKVAKNLSGTVAEFDARYANFLSKPI